jgi:hypothetical protein
MLQVPNLIAINIEDPTGYLYDALVAIQNFCNSLAQQISVDGNPSSSTPANATADTALANFPSPAPPSSISVNAQSVGDPVKLYNVELGLSPDDDDSIRYYLEYTTDPKWGTATALRMGNQTQKALMLPNNTYYWRARAKKVQSNYSSYLYFGSQANPTGV